MTKKNIDLAFERLLKEIKANNPNSDISKIRKAWEFAKLAHAGQKRLSGEPYIVHILEVAMNLANWKLDTTSIVAGILHDTVEDGGAKREDLVSGFGEDVALLVDGVTKVTEYRLKGSKEAEFIENLRKMLLVMAKDLRVILVKLADRLHNMQTLYALSPASQKENARETLEVYAPLAERLGIGRIKGELEDLSFAYVYPKDHKKLKESAEPYYIEAEEHIHSMTKTLEIALARQKIHFELHGRKKHLYSLWRKLQRPEINWDFDKVNDIVALRIIVKTPAECYVSLGVVHSKYKPVPHIGVSDFIAQPKPNGYRSIHTKVFGPGGRIVEVQIRTQQMHEQAEMGIAAHWAYAEKKASGAAYAILGKGISVPADKLLWVKRLVEWQKEITDSEEFLKAVKFDALKHRNFVFSPDGDVYDLPVGATPIDFAYAIHSDLGKYISGAKVDGKLVPLDFELESGQVVEILKSKNIRKPSEDWLAFTVTTQARREISKHLRKSSQLK